jgi:thioredoxin 1
MEIKAKDFSSKVINSNKPVLVEFWASWCLPCQTAKKQLKVIKDKIGDEINVYKINIDQNPSMSSKFEIMGLPTFIFFKDGKEISRLIGSQTENNLLNLVNDNIN